MSISFCAGSLGKPNRVLSVMRCLPLTEITFALILSDARHTLDIEVENVGLNQGLVHMRGMVQKVHTRYAPQSYSSLSAGEK